MKCPRCGSDYSQSGVCEKCKASDGSQRSPEKQRAQISVYRILLAILIIIAIAGASAFARQLLFHHESNDKKMPVTSGLLDPSSRLDEHYQYAGEAIRYSVIYHNAFFKDNAPLSVEKLEINDNSDLILEVRRGEERFRFDEHLVGEPLEDVLARVLRALISNPPARPMEQAETDKLNKYLDSGDQFDYARALRMVHTHLKTAKYPHSVLLTKAARAYLSICLANHSSSVSSFYDDLISRAVALFALSSLDQQQIPSEDFYYTKAMLSYLSGNTKRAFDIASTPEAKKENKSGIFLTIKKPAAVSSEDHTLPIIYWKLLFSGSEGFEISGEEMEKLVVKNPDNLYVLSWLANKGVGEGRIYGPVLIEKTLQEHLSFIAQEYPDWAASLQKEHRLFPKENSTSPFSQFQSIVRSLGAKPKNNSQQHIVPGYESMKKVSQSLFKGKNQPVKLEAELFSVEDERRFFYHNVLTAVAIWQDLLTARWCVLDQAASTSDELNEIFKDDPLIRLLYADVLLGKDKNVEKSYHLMANLIQETGDRKLLLRILGVSQFTKWRAAQTGPLMKKLALRFQENGRFLNSLGNVAVLKDEAKRTYLEEGIRLDPWNVSAVYNLSWENSDFSLMKRLIQDSPENAKALYKAAYLVYKRFGDVRTAIEYLKKTVNIQPSHHAAVSFLGTLLRNEGRYGEAIKVYESYLKVDSESLSSVDMRNMIGYTFLSLNKPDEAIRIFAETAETYKASAVRGAVEAYLAAGDKTNAELWAKRLVDRYNDKYSMDTLCRLYYRTGETEKLKQAIEKYKKLYPIYTTSLATGWNARLTQPALFRIKLGAIVLFVLRDTSAYDAGLRNGDIVLFYNKIPLNSGFDFAYYSYPRDKDKTLTVLRAGNIIKLPIKDEPWSEIEG